MKDRDLRRLRRHTIFVRSVIILVLIFGLISFVLYVDPSLINTPEEQYKGNLIWLIVGTVFVAFGVFSFFFIGRWSRHLVWIFYNVVPVPMHLVLKVEEDSEATQYYAHLTPMDMNIMNQPFDFPRSKARGLLRVDTERRFLPRPEGRGLAPSKYQKIWRIALWGPSHENMKTHIGRDIKAQVYFDPKSGRPAVIESEFGLLWAMAGSGATEKKE